MYFTKTEFLLLCFAFGPSWLHTLFFSSSQSDFLFLSRRESLSEPPLCLTCLLSPSKCAFHGHRQSLWPLDSSFTSWCWRVSRWAPGASAAPPLPAARSRLWAARSDPSAPALSSRSPALARVGSSSQGTGSKARLLLLLYRLLVFSFPGERRRREETASGTLRSRTMCPGRSGAPPLRWRTAKEARDAKRGTSSPPIPRRLRWGARRTRAEAGLLRMRCALARLLCARLAAAASGRRAALRWPVAPRRPKPGPPSARWASSSPTHPETRAPSRSKAGLLWVWPRPRRSPVYPVGLHTTPPTLHHTAAPRQGGTATPQSSHQSVAIHRHNTICSHT